MLKNKILILLSLSFLLVASSVQANNSFLQRESREPREPRLIERIICSTSLAQLWFHRMCSVEPIPDPEPEPICGNDIKEDGEACDGLGGVTEGFFCTDQCTLEVIPICGDGVINQASEECDIDDGVTEGFHCTDQCMLEADEVEPFCGDGIVNQSFEDCDIDDGVTEGFMCTTECKLTPAGEAKIVINEVFANVDPAHGIETNNEWIELYNAGTAAMSLLDLQIQDSSNSIDAIQDDIILNPGEFALISSDISTFDTFWLAEIPAGTHLIIINGRIGNGLNNSGDGLILKNAQGIIDAMSYGDDKSFFDLTGVSEGNSLSRTPNGKDTDTAQDWVELDDPTPGS